jgi:NADH-quinone oxidoreductase subunit G
MYRSASGTGAAGLGPAELSPWERYKAAKMKPSVDWAAVTAAVREGFRHVVSRNGASSVLGVVSPFATVEEAYLLAKWLKGFGEGAALALGPVPVRGEPEKFKSGFTIRPEKAPNRRGVEAVLAHFSGGGDGTARVSDFAAVRGDIKGGRYKAVFVVGGYPDTALLDAAADELRKAEFLVVLDILAGKLSDSADAVLAGASFAEREGSWVNHAGVLQRFDWAFPPVGEARRDGQVLWELAGRTGLFHSADVLSALAAEIPAFAEAAAGRPPAEGLKLAKLAESKP